MALDPGMQNLQMPGAQAGQLGGGAIQSELPQGQPSTTAPPQETQQYGQQAGYDGEQRDPNANMVDFGLSQANLAKNLAKKNQELLDKMGAELYQAYQDDEQSRQDWMKVNKEWMKLALLTRENKTWPWPKAANVKYPLIATAAMQFSARAYPALVPSDGSIVKARVSAVDQQGQLEQAAIRVSKHMSYQIACDMDNWEEDMDKLLMTIAVSGLCFKKTYYDALEKKMVSKLVYPENLCMNYWTKSLENCYRKTELLHYNMNEIKEMVQNKEHFLDIEYGDSSTSEIIDNKQPVTTRAEQPSKNDEATPHTFLAVHTFWDLDKDGYEEPYIITIHKNTRKVVRIIARWDSDGIFKDDDDKIIKIRPVEYFTDYPFVPNPDGSIYALGFGMLLGPLNEACNTLINQLVDAGTLANLQGGFIARNLRMKEGQVQLRPGEWKVVNGNVEDLQKSFFPLPAKEPSNVLMSLLQMLITSGNQLASIAEIFVGKMPGQNTPATTTQETIQQGMAVFTAIYKRVYRSLAKEFKKIFRLNRVTPDIVEDESYIVGQIQQSDYEYTEHLIIPGADPSGDSATVRAQKYQQVAQLLQMGTINPMVLTQRILEGMDIPNYQELIAQPQPQQDPKIQTEQIKQQTMQQKAQLDSQAKQQDMQNKAQQAKIDQQVEMAKLQAKEKELQIKVQTQQMDAMHKRQLAALEHQQARRMANMDMVTATTKMQQEAQKGQMQVEHQQALQDAELARSDDLHNQEMKQMKQKAAVQKQTKPKGAK